MALSIIILALCLIAIVFYLSRITKNLHSDFNGKDSYSQKNLNLLDEARMKAIKIVDNANNQALDIISQITLSADTASENFKEEITRTSSAQIKEFEKATSDFTALYFQILQDLKTKNIEVFQNISKDIEEHTMTEVENFKESMQKLTALSQEEVRKKIDADYIVSKREVENYKQEELKKIDSAIYELLEKISKFVLGKALNLSEHEDLIQTALEKGKKEGIFNT